PPFSGYPQTSLTMHQTDDPHLYNTSVCLVFYDVKSVVRVYYDPGANDFPYQFAPEGMGCTVVAVGVRDSILYSSFTPITIGTNQTVNFTLHQTTDTLLHQAIDALN